MDERALLELLDRDPNAAMEALLERCGPLLRYVVGGVLRDPQDAEDCYSAVTELLWRRLGLAVPDVSFNKDVRTNKNLPAGVAGRFFADSVIGSRSSG